jgi:hypothetical protein
VTMHPATTAAGVAARTMFASAVPQMTAYFCWRVAAAMTAMMIEGGVMTTEATIAGKEMMTAAVIIVAATTKVAMTSLVAVASAPAFRADLAVTTLAISPNTLAVHEALKPGVCVSRKHQTNVGCGACQFPIRISVRSGDLV